MIDESIMQSLEPDVAAAVDNAILTIANSLAIQRQLAQGMESIVAGAVDEDPAILASRILKFRRENHGLIALLERAAELKKDMQNA